MTTYAVAVNRTHRGKMSTSATPGEWAAFNDAFANQSLTPDQLAYLIREGYSYTTHHAGRRKAANFIMGQHIAFDMDTMDERSTLDVLAADPLIDRYAALLHTTASHRPDAPRARVVFLLDRPIPRTDKYTLLAQALLHHFGQADPKCKDACRLFYGAEGCDVRLLGNTLTLEDAARHLVSPYKAHLQAEEARREQEWAEREATRGTASDDLVTRYIDNAFEGEKRALADLEEGSRHTSLLNAAMRLGGLVKASWATPGVATESRVYLALEAASQKNGLWADDGEASVQATIRDGLRYATPRQEPAWDEREEATQPSVILPEVILTPEQVARERAAIERIRAEGWWQGFHDGMTTAQRSLWQQEGLPAGAIDHFQLGFSQEREARTIPYFEDGQLVNIEYLHDDGGYSYESDLMGLYTAHAGDGQRLVLPDALSAIQATVAGWNILHGYRVTGLPHAALHGETLEALAEEPSILLVEPTMPEGEARALHQTSRLLYLPASLPSLFTHGLTAEAFRRYLRQAA